MKKLLIILILLMLPSLGLGADQSDWPNVYIDSSAGNGGDGSQASPYNNLADINWTTGGDNSVYDALNGATNVTIHLKRGSVFRGERMLIGASGTATGTLTICDYGEGNKPIIDAAPAVSFSDDGDGTYSYSTTTNTYGVIEDDVLLLRASSSALDDGYWFYDFDGDVLHYKPTSGVPGSHTIRRIVVTACSLSTTPTQSYTTFRNISVRYALIAFYFAPPYTTGTSITNLTIDNCDISYCCEAINIQTRNGNDNSTIAITDNIVTYCGKGIQILADAGGTGKNNSITITGNTLENIQVAANGQLWEDDYGLPSDEEGISLQNLNTSTVSMNTVTGGCDGGGIASWVNSLSEADNNIVIRNRLDSLDGPGIAWGGGGANTSTGNLLAFNLVLSCGSDTGIQGGFRINRSQNPPNRVYNNVVYGCDVSFYLYSLTDYYDLKNNISISPATSHVDTDVSIGNNTLSYNCYYPDTGTMFDLNGSAYNLTDWKTNSSQDVNSFSSDPKFISTTDFYLQATSPCINAGTSPFSDGDGDQYDYAGNLVWSDTTDGTIGAWSDGVEIGAYGWFGGVLLQ